MDSIHIPFNDSSDDDAPVVGVINVLHRSGRGPDSETSLPSSQNVADHNLSCVCDENRSRWTGVVNFCTRVFTWALADTPHADSVNEPIFERNAAAPDACTDADDAVPSSSHSEGRTESVATTEVAETPAAAVDDVQEQHVDIDLHDTILKYKTTGLEFYFNIILVTLKYNTRPVSSDLFVAAQGSPLVLQTLMCNGHVDENDPTIICIVQQEVDNILQGDVYCGQYINADQAEYLRCLCQLRTIRLNLRQVLLIEYSGYEFIKIITDYPYLLCNIQIPNLCLLTLGRLMRLMRFIVSWLGIFVSALFQAAIIWTVIFWFEQSSVRNNAYWTILCYVVAYVLSIVWTFRVSEGKIQDYDDRCWSYPSRNLKLIPLFPIYELLLTSTALRYKITPEHKRYIVISHDLRNDISLQHEIFDFVNSVPQIVVQLYLFTRGNNNTISVMPTCFWLLIASGATCHYMSIICFMSKTINAHSCNEFGFALMIINNTRESHRQRVFLTHIITHILMFALTYFLVVISVSLLIALLNTRDCTGRQIVFLSVYVFVVAVTALLLIFLFIYINITRMFGLLCIGVVAMEVSRYIYVGIDQRHYPMNYNRCLLMDHLEAIWTIPIYATFGYMSLFFLIWAILVIYENVTSRRLSLRCVHTLFFL